MNRVWGTIRSAGTWLQKRYSAQAAILMYHRIASPELDPWGLSVSPEHFAEHLEVIREQAQPMSLHQLAAAHREGNIPHRAVVVTFDDGYADNLHQAKPLLEKYDIPATVFVTSGYLDSDREFWWDELERVLLRPGRLPETLSLTIGGDPKQWQLGAATDYTSADFEDDRDRKAWECKPNSRLAFYYSVWSVLRTLPEHQRKTLQDKILVWANASVQARADYRALTTQELLKLGQGSIVDIGAHTMTHPELAGHSLEFQRDEIQRSKQRLEQLLGYSVKSFAYPFGSFNQSSVQAVQACEFQQACSTIQQQVWQGSDRFQLPRFEVQNWTKAVFEQKLNQWLH